MELTILEKLEALIRGGFGEIRVEHFDGDADDYVLLMPPPYRDYRSEKLERLIETAYAELKENEFIQ